MNTEPDASPFPDLTDEGAAAVNDFLEDLYCRFQSHYFAQLHRHYQQQRDIVDESTEPPLKDPPF